MRSGPGVIYVFEPYPGTLKVGYTRNLVQRLSDFQINHSLETQVLRLALVTDPLEAESRILDAVIPWRVGDSEFLLVPVTEYYGVLAVFDFYAEEFSYDDR